MYKYKDQILKGDAKAKFTQQANLVGSCTVGDFTMVLATMTDQIFFALAYQDQKWYMYRYLRNHKTMKVSTFTIKLIQPINYFPYFLPDYVGQMVIALSDDKIKKILYPVMPDLWRKKMIKQQYSYQERSIQEMLGFFERHVQNLETLARPRAARSLHRKKIIKNSKKQKSVSFEDSDNLC